MRFILALVICLFGYYLNKQCPDRDVSYLLGFLFSALASLVVLYVKLQ